MVAGFGSGRWAGLPGINLCQMGKVRLFFCHIYQEMLDLALRDSCDRLFQIIGQNITI